MDLLEVNEAVLRQLKDVEEAESYAVKSRTLAVYVDGSKVKNVETKEDAGIAVRVINGSRLGAASSALSDEASLSACAESALHLASLSPVDPKLRGFSIPSSMKIPKPPVIDPAIVNLEASELAELAEMVVSSASPAAVPRGLLRVSTIDVAVTNSNGVALSRRSTMLYAHFMSMVREPMPGEGMEAYYSVSLDMDPEYIGSELRRKAANHARAGHYNGNEFMDMILPPSELGDMTLSSVGSALNGENVVLGRSPWRESLGRQVASEEVIIVDDPSLPSLLAAEFDDEGTPTEKRVLVDKGVLKGFMFDNYNGVSTGNAWRRDPVDPQGSYCLPLRIGPSNMRISPGRMSPEEIIEETEQGVFVERLAWPEADPLTGRFGLELRCGHIIRGGEIVATVKGALLAGSMFEAWRNVRFIGNDSANTSRGALPTMSFVGARLVGE